MALIPVACALVETAASGLGTVQQADPTSCTHVIGHQSRHVTVSRPRRFVGGGSPDERRVSR